MPSNQYAFHATKLNLVSAKTNDDTFIRGMINEIFARQYELKFLDLCKNLDGDTPAQILQRKVNQESDVVDDCISEIMTCNSDMEIEALQQELIDYWSMQIAMRNVQITSYKFYYLLAIFLLLLLIIFS